MLRRHWLSIAILTAATGMYLFEGVWYNLFYTHAYYEMKPALRVEQWLLFSAFAKVPFSWAIAFVYLQLQEEQRTIVAGFRIGAVIGALIGAYQFLDWFGWFHVSHDFVMREFFKTLIMAFLSGGTISFFDAALNPRPVYPF